MRSRSPSGIALAMPAALLVALIARPSAAGAQSASEISVEDLAWIAGHWGGEAFGGQVEEAWLAPAGRSMSGSFRMVREGLAVMYELLLIEQDDDGEIYYRFKHVGRGWEPWEETRLEYRLTELEGRRATFRSTAGEPAPNAPWWFTYERTDRGLDVSIYGSEGGPPTVLSMQTR